MDPRVIHFLYFNGAIVFLVVLYLAWRPKRNPSRLKLRETLKRDKLEPIKQAGIDFRNAPEHSTRNERQLNVIFQFNGHDFDAHEVLGVPAGSSKDKVEESYRQIIANSSKDAHEFYRIAYEAIKRK
jgi:hypothetical protein